MSATASASRRAAAATVAVLVLLGAIVVLGRVSVPGQPAPAGSVIRYGISVTSITEVNPTDALAASLIFSRAIGRAVGAWQDARAELFADSAGLVRAVNADHVDLLALSSMEFLSVERSLKADPFLVYQTGPGLDAEYVLLVRDGLTSVRDLAGRRVAVYNPSPQRDVGDTWLDVQLMEAGLGESARSTQLRVVKKRSQATLALFFKQVDAAVEPKSAFDTAVELNPQIGRELRILARSPRLLPAIVCVRRSMEPDLRQRYLAKATDMHLLADYKQTFVMLHVSRLVAFEPRYLENTRALADRYQALVRRRQPAR